MNTNVLKGGLFAIVAGALFFVFKLFSGTGEVIAEVEDTNADKEKFPQEISFPEGSSGHIIQRKYFCLSYNEYNEQADWLQYKLTKNYINGNADREHFLNDPLVESGSASASDYSNSGYDRGHLVPAADMVFSEEAMHETFFMSNISPQKPKFNRGIWRELEEQVRDWVQSCNTLYIVAGPLFMNEELGVIGVNEVRVPSHFFKVILDFEGNGKKGVAFLFPNEASDLPITDFAMSIDELEKKTGYNFFPKIAEEESIESKFNASRWMYDEERFKTRKAEM